MRDSQEGSKGGRDRSATLLACCSLAVILLTASLAHCDVPRFARGHGGLQIAPPATIEARREDSCASSADAPEVSRAEGGRLGSPLVGYGVRESLGACLPDRATEGRCIGATGRRLARSRHTWPSICASVSDAPVPTAASWKRRQCGEMPRLKRRETSAMKMTWARARTRARARLGARLRARDWGKD